MIQPFLEFVIKAYRNLTSSMKVAFEFSFRAQQAQPEVSHLGPDTLGNQACEYLFINVFIRRLSKAFE